MKIRVTMKRPDALDDGIDEALDGMHFDAWMDEEERRYLKQSRKEKIRTLAGRWFEYGEYLTVEIDTTEETCTVLPAKS